MQKKTIAAIVVVFCLLVLLGRQDSSDRESIDTWAATNKHVVSSIDRHYFDIGPFWYGEDCRIYKVQVEDGKTFWFRFRLLATDIERKDDEAQSSE
jgi:hypothetical protein